MRATAAASESPKPEPGREREPSSRTKRSRTRVRSAGAIPGPRSATVSTMDLPARRAVMLTSGFASPMLFFGDRFVEFADALGSLAYVEWLKRSQVATRFRACDQQEGVEDTNELVRFLDRLLQRLTISRSVTTERERCLGVVAQARERRAQVMRDVVGDLLKALHQFRDPAEHLVQAFRQPVQFVARAGHRQAAREVAGHDPVRRGVHVVDSLQHPPGDE